VLLTAGSASGAAARVFLPELVESAEPPELELALVPSDDDEAEDGGRGDGLRLPAAAEWQPQATMRTYFDRHDTAGLGALDLAQVRARAPPCTEGG
jgi:hypothetical protein